MFFFSFKTLSLLSMSKMPPQRFLALYKILKLFCCNHLLFFNKSRNKLRSIKFIDLESFQEHYELCYFQTPGLRRNLLTFLLTGIGFLLLLKVFF